MSLAPHLQPSALVGEMPRQVKRQKEATIELGWAGFCPRQPRLVLPIFDDSGSVSLPGGGDPVGNRYEEAHLAFAALQEWCSCGKCLAGVLHFDTPRGDVDPGKLRSPTFQQHLKRGLRVPRFAAGSSVLGPSLTRAEEIAGSFLKHEVRLVVLTDWQLFDTDNVLERLRGFPGAVLAIGLNANPPSPLDGDDIVGLRVGHDDPPGAVARALFGELPPETNLLCKHKPAPETAPTGVFFEGRRKVLRNSQQPRNSGPDEVKWEGKRRPAPMAYLAPAPRPSRSHSGAQPRPSHSQFTQFVAPGNVSTLRATPSCNSHLRGSA